MAIWTGAIMLSIPISIAFGRMLGKAMQPRCKACGVKDFPVKNEGEKFCRNCSTPFPEED